MIFMRKATKNDGKKHYLVCQYSWKIMAVNGKIL